MTRAAVLGAILTGALLVLHPAPLRAGTTAPATTPAPATPPALATPPATADGIAGTPVPAPVTPEETRRSLLGVGRLFDNDAIGDGHDRWQTGSYTISLIEGRGWDGHLPRHFGSLLEYRFAVQLVTPANLTRPAASDRRYAGILSFGLRTHFALGPAETSLGLDMDATGPQTGIGWFQRQFHSLLDMTQPSRSLSNQIGDHFYPTLTAEMGHSFNLGQTVSLRPFVEAEAGLETFARVGGDITLGHFGRGDLLARDSVTGQRYRVIRTDHTPGLSLVLGADIAHVSQSHLLPEGGAAVLEPTRKRVRIGVNWQSRRTALFYGVTWLSREFKSQPENQLVGSLHISLRF